MEIHFSKWLNVKPQNWGIRKKHELIKVHVFLMFLLEHEQISIVKSQTPNIPLYHAMILFLKL